MNRRSFFKMSSLSLIPFLGTTTEAKDKSQEVSKTEYDSNGDLSYRRYKNGDEVRFLYHSNGKVSYQILSTKEGNILYQYDIDGNFIYSENSFPNGKRYTREEISNIK